MPDRSAPLLEIDRVKVRFPGGTVALEDVSITVAVNEIVTIIGPSGCGKSTLLNCMAGFLKPTAGRVLREGQPVTRPKADCPVVFQDLNQLFAWRTVLSNLVYAISVTGHGRGKAARERASQYLDLVGIRRAEQHYPHQLSGGMKQRAAIARALAIEPQLLLMDEPFGALDAITRAQLQLELKQIARERRLTVLFVTHSVEEALFLGDRVVVMSANPGRVVRMTEASDISDFDHPDLPSRVSELRSLLLPGSSGPDSSSTTSRGDAASGIAQ